ncbi:hypothetical protein [Saccharothrix lopnurensis]|uniref:Ribbon-helix-helix CopG family protein n=1 Tax=Saccharothrix lopnurensis TaxID=1670621 RepID=A0ABW1P5S7_9PSEU
MAARARGEGKTPHRQFRAEDDVWAKFGEAVKPLGTDRSAVLRDFVRWFVREPGAKMPRRPDSSKPPVEPGRNPGDDSPREN